MKKRKLYDIQWIAMIARSLFHQNNCVIIERYQDIAMESTI